MSVTAIIMLAEFLIFGGPVVHEQDEGFGAHMFQLLIMVEIPIIVYFVLTWYRRKPKQTIIVLSLQLITLIMAVAPVLIFQF